MKFLDKYHRKNNNKDFQLTRYLSSCLFTLQFRIQFPIYFLLRKSCNYIFENIYCEICIKTVDPAVNQSIYTNLCISIHILCARCKAVQWGLNSISNFHFAKIRSIFCSVTNYISTNETRKTGTRELVDKTRVNPESKTCKICQNCTMNIDSPPGVTKDKQGRENKSYLYLCHHFSLPTQTVVWQAKHFAGTSIYLSKLYINFKRRFMLRNNTKSPLNSG